MLLDELHLVHIPLLLLALDNGLSVPQISHLSIMPFLPWMLPSKIGQDNLLVTALLVLVDKLSLLPPPKSKLPSNPP